MNLFLNDTACNLASLNLLKFKNADGSFNVERFQAACRIFITAQEILVDNSSYPTKWIAENSHIFRPLGLGYANLGALLMSMGLPYDSDAGREMCASITALMTGTAYHQSAVLAEAMGPFAGYLDARCSGVDVPVAPSNRESMLKVIGMHTDAAVELHDRVAGTSAAFAIVDAATTAWDQALELGRKAGYRNAQVSVLAPIESASDCFTGDTLVAVADGRNAVSLKQLAHEGRDIDVYASDAGKTVVRRMTNVRLVRMKTPVVNIMLDDGSRVRCTPEHQMMLRDGTYKRADELLPGTSLMRFDSDVSVEPGARRRKIWMGPNAGGNRSKGKHWKLQYRLTGGRLFPGYDGRSGGIIHHVNEDTLDDSYFNLQLCAGTSEHQQLHWAAKSPEERSAIIKARCAARTPEQRRETARKIHESQTPEQRKERARKAVAAHTTSERSAWIKSGWSNISPEDRVKRSKKAWDTRRQKAMNHKVVTVVPDGIEDVYCGEVEGVHNFAIVTTTGFADTKTDALSGVVVHNCDNILGQTPRSTES